MSSVRRFHMGLAAAAFAALPGQGHAQTGGADAASSGGGIETVIVTAERREENLQNVPVSVSALSGDALARRAIVSEQDLRTSTVGLTVRAEAGDNELNYAIRGQSVDAYSDARPGVLPYFNEVQVSGDAGASTFYDLQSIQVLRGPQGTLFGRSATGGAVLFTSEKPGPEFGGYATGSLGDFAFKDFEGAVNLPVSENLRTRVAGFYQDDNGYQYNLLTHGRFGGTEKFGVRASATLQEGDFKNNLVVSYSHTSGTSLANVIQSIDSAAATPAATAVLFSPALDGIFGPGAWNAILAANPGASPLGLAGELARQKASGPFVTNVDGVPLFKSQSVFATNASTYDVSDSIQIKNIVGFGQTQIERNTDNDGTAFPGSNVHQRERGTQVSEELQLLGDTDGLKYVAGVFFSNEHTTEKYNTTFLDLSPLLAPTELFYHFTKATLTYAAYGQATYDLSHLTSLDGLSATGGVRYTNERATLSIKPDDTIAPCATFGCSGFPASDFSNHQSTTSKNLSYTLGLQEQIWPSLLVYAETRRAYKGGGFNGSLIPFIGTGSVGGDRYLAERVTDAEIGVKFQDYIGSMPFRFNAALFEDWIGNAQRTAFVFVNGAPASITMNVPTSLVRGAEIDAELSPTSWLSLGGTFAYNDAKFVSNSVLIQGIPALVGPYPDTPKSSGSVFAQVDVPVVSDYRLVIRGDDYAQSRVWITSTGRTNPTAFNPGFAIANFSLGVENEAQGWSVTAYVKNAFDRTYYVGGQGLAQLLQFNSALPGDPRTFFVKARKEF